MVYFHLSDSWEAKRQLRWVTWLRTLEQSYLSCGRVWVHSKYLCIVQGLFHIKRKLTGKRASQVVSTRVSWKSIQGINKPGPLCKVVLGREICQLFQATQKYYGQYMDGTSITAKLADFLNSQKINEQRAVCTSCQILSFSSLSLPKMFWGAGGSFIPQAEYPSVVYNQRQALHTQWAI